MKDLWQQDYIGSLVLVELAIGFRYMLTYAEKVSVMLQI